MKCQNLSKVVIISPDYLDKFTHGLGGALAVGPPWLSAAYLSKHLQVQIQPPHPLFTH
jgi:hypothetical protein